MRKLRIYLAGPDVFLRNPMSIAQRKKDICTRYSFEGVFPLDNKLSPEGRSPTEFGMAISSANENMMDGCDLMIANMTPFRGPSMDVGTAYEMGYMRAQGKPVFGYSNTDQRYFERVSALFCGELRQRADGRTWEDPHGMSVENFSLMDNLMLEGAVDGSGANVETESVARDDAWSDLAAFERCVAKAAKP